MLKVAIIGMPNVGKSTLFNALLGKRFAIVHDEPGVTRDYKVSVCNFLDLEFELIDTAGWESDNKELSHLMQEQTKFAIDSADVTLLMLDARRDINGYERDLIDYLRKMNNNDFSNCKVILNKAERGIELDINEIYRFGFDDYITTSATEKIGFDEIYQFLKEKVDHHKSSSTENILDKKPIAVAVVGKPNAGKSTLFNGLLSQNRAIVSDFSGTTRDTISHVLNHNDHMIELIDTAGLRKRGKINDIVEEFSAASSITAIRRAHVILLVIDATVEELDKQEVKIAGIAQNEGKPIIVILNKVDLMRNKSNILRQITKQIHDELNDSKSCLIVLKSALHDTKHSELLDNVISLYEKWLHKFKTNQLNNWLIDAQTDHLPPLSSNGRRIKLKYITQHAIKPPSFKVFCNYPTQLPGSYLRYLRNNIVDKFQLHGIPIRFDVVKADNPYEK